MLPPPGGTRGITATTSLSEKVVLSLGSVRKGGQIHLSEQYQHEKSVYKKGSNPIQGSLILGSPSVMASKLEQLKLVHSG